MADYPEHEKLAALKERHSGAQDFYDHLIHTRGLHLARYHKHTDECTPDGFRSAQCGYFDGALEPVYIRPEELLASFLGIDEKKLEAEKRAMLDVLRKANG